MEKIELLKSLDFGSRVAEDEAKTLAEYFVETEQWRKIRDDNIDIIYGPKGSGKSAIFSLLISEFDLFKDKGIHIIPAENIRGEPVFKSLDIGPTPSEQSLLILWKLYILGLIAQNLRETGEKSIEAVNLISSMEEAKLLPRIFDIESLLRAVKNYLKSFLNNRSAKEKTYRIELNESTMLPEALSASYSFEGSDENIISKIPITGLLKVADKALIKANRTIWIALDRLDVAFVETKILEKNALRALFRTYNDLKGLQNVSLKIFVRDDLIDRINEDGFTEASHITRTSTIKWDRNELLHLVFKRFIRNKSICDYFNIAKPSTLRDIEKQEELISLIFPDKIDTGKNPKTFDWIISRLQDGKYSSTPREIIHILECITTNQVERLRRGESKGAKTPIYDRSVFKQSLAEVSKAKYENTLCAEYPEYKKFLEKLRGGKAEYLIEHLSTVWNLNIEDTEEMAVKLHKIGFFEKKMTKKYGVTFWIPFIYRDALSIIKGVYRASRISPNSIPPARVTPTKTGIKFTYEKAIQEALKINKHNGNHFISGSEITKIINTENLNGGQNKENTNVSRALRGKSILSATWIEYIQHGDRKIFRHK